MIKNARILLAPIRFGAGIKGKLSDAMECGTPNITTSIGAEGMLEIKGTRLDTATESLNWNGEVIPLIEMMNNPATFANAAVKAYQDESMYHQYQQNGFEILSQQYDKTYWQEQLIARLTSQCETLTDARKNNFFGLMLRHHSMKSTQYMAQWIEAKNKP